MLLRRVSRLIEIKRKARDEKKRELNSLMEILNETIKQIFRTKEEYAGIVMGLENSIVEGSGFQTIRDYLILLEQKEKELESEKRYLEAKIATIRDELLKLYRDLKKLEILKEKINAFQKREDSKRLQKLLDELSTRKSRSSIS